MNSPNGTPSNMGGNNMACQGEMGSQGMGGNNMGNQGMVVGEWVKWSDGSRRTNEFREPNGRWSNQGDMGVQGNMGMGTDKFRRDKATKEWVVGRDGSKWSDGSKRTDNSENQMGDGANQGGQAEGGGEMSDDVIPMYSKAPVFDDIIGQGESITNSVRYGITRGDADWNLITNNRSRVAPKVLHMEQVTGSRTSIIAPKNYDEDVYVVITYDVNDDGRGDDDC